MDFADVSLVALRVFREVAERGTLTSAAAALGYTQSAVSRQVASLERAAGRKNNGASSWPASRTRSPSQPPASPTPCVPQPPTRRHRVNPRQPRPTLRGQRHVWA